MRNTFPYRLFSTILLFLFFFINVAARELYFSKVNGDNGLSESNVKAIAQDSYGFMWFGTKNGLDRYDGKYIKTFNVYDPVTGRNDRNVAAIQEDDNKRLWIGTDTGIFIFDPITEQFSFFQHTASNGGFLDNWVADIKKDNHGNIWIVIPGQGVFKYLIKEDKLIEYRLAENQDQIKSPQCIFISNSGEIWIGSNGMGIFLFDETVNKFVRFLNDKSGNSLENKNVFTMCEYRNKLVLGIHEGKLMCWDMKSNMLQDFNTPEVHNKIIRQVVSYNNRELLIATQNGLFVYNEMEKKLTHYREDGLNPYSLSDNTIYSIYKDREEGIWVGTLLGGVNYAPNRNVEFEKYVPSNNRHSLSTKKIRELSEDPHGNIWIGTEDGGVNIFDPGKKTFSVFEKARNNITNLALYNDGSRMYLGHFKRELDVVDLSSKTVRHYSQKELGLNEESICAFLKDSRGRYWLGNAREINLCEDESFRFKPRHDIANGYIYDIQEDQKGNIWIATIGSGVYCYNPETGESKHFLHDSRDSTSLSSNTVSSITIDPRDIVWLSTDRGGLCCYNRNEDNFTTYSIKDGFPDDVVYKVLVDKQYNLWFGTNKGLVKFNPDTKSVRVFTKSDGLLGNQFSYKSALASRNGKFYFGGIDGLISFNPYYELKNSNVPPVYITHMYIYNKEVNLGDADSPLSKSLLFPQEIKLDYKQSNISFNFAVLSYSATAANAYAYKLEGVDRDWIYTYNQSAFYSQLLPGKYTFRVKGANNDGIWNNAGVAIDIIITPPWWKSVYAYIVYTLIIFFIFYYLIYYFNRKKELKALEAQKLFEIKKEHELYRAKVDFFTSIAHEIKTPLSLIKAPVEEVNKHFIEDEFIRKSLYIIELNTNRLLNLVNQLLDFRKIDANKVTLYFTLENVTELLQEITLRFEPSIKFGKKDISLELPAEALFAPVDKEVFTKILSNLLNNALKYSKSFIKVILNKEEANFSIHVISNGKTIPQNQREKIFQPFFQLHNKQENTSGIGIGLSLARSLAELHSGKLQLCVDNEGNNDFFLTLPLHQDKILNVDFKESEHLKEVVISPEIQSPKEEYRYTVMVVDDNEEILYFLNDRLSHKFNVITASNGQEALEKLTSNNVHLIISDVMMPVIDGLELCTQVKNNLEYSHIPVILLTAKNDLDSKIKGLEAGADAYLEKPFSFNYLVAQASNLLSNREKEREAFAKRPFFPVYNLKMNKSDEEFMNRVLEQIQANISDENFNVERLAELLHMSRSVLHKKIKNLVHMVPVDFIRVIRLKKAAELIQEGKNSIAEISVMVGVSSPSYFSKLFQKQFGVTPKVFSMKNKKGEKIM